MYKKMIIKKIVKEEIKKMLKTEIKWKIIKLRIRMTK
jgi:hypothetical protein